MKIARSIKQKIKKKIIGSGLGPLYEMEILSELFRLGKWIKNNKTAKYFKSRFDLYRYVNDEILNDTAIDYFEFGVYKGASLKTWTEINKNSKSRFFGFDSFKGLPEKWKMFSSSFPKGTFDTKGETPFLKDSRVNLIKGYFQDTLREFLARFVPKYQIIIHIDSDLYTSSLYVLTNMDEYLAPGAIIIFDEFSSPNNEFKSFINYTEAYKKEYEVICSVNTIYDQVAIRITK